jgi:putative membrane-bound dehydrogenase-like protein
MNCMMMRSTLGRPSYYLQLAVLILPVAMQSRCVAADPAEVQSPVSPRNSLKYLVVQDGLKVELAASEPNVIDPVAVRFDEAGRMWVVEMRDYPMTEITGDDVHSVLKVLDDRNGDGFYEKMAVVADDLRYATGVQPWKGGAFVTLAGKVVYLKDTSGDDKADVVETWYTGFSEMNQQLRANHPRLALDGHIYIANGLRGGKVVDARNPGAKPVSLSGMDFRFDPLTGRCEAVSGSCQFGLTFDDYGNRFICSNRNPAMHVVFENDELKKNPLVAVPGIVHDVAKAGEDSRVYPIAKSWTTSNLHAGQFTAACGLDIYRSNELGPAFRGNLFVCEPTGHLVHREIIRPKGVTFESTPAYDSVEFLASRDAWFSPVNLEGGPDGSLYVVDMYRAVIEHPEWVPEELKRRPDELHGNDRGRIYRIVPKDFKRPPRPNLAAESSDALVKHLANPDAWWRETAARLLLERQDKSIGPKLVEVATGSKSSAARIHALWLLNSFGMLHGKTLPSAFNDDPRVAEQVLRLAALRPDSTIDAAVLAKYSDDADPRVRFRAVLAMPPGSPRLPSKHKADSWEMYGRLIAAGQRAGELLVNLSALKAATTDSRRVVAEAARLAAASGDEQIDKAIQGLTVDDALGRAGLTSLLTEASRRGMAFKEVRSRASAKNQPALDRVVEAARRDAVDPQKTNAVRSDAIDLVAAAGDGTELLTQITLEDPQQPIRLRAIAGLAKGSGTDAWQQLLASYSQETPALQRAILDGLFVSPERLTLLLDAVEAGDVKATELDANHAKRLIDHADATISERAEKLLKAAIPADREKVLADYQVVLTLESDPTRGRGVFEKNCAICHRIGDVGTSVAPDISDSRERLPAQLLTDILQPNRAIDSNYFGYTAITTEGLTHTGILSAETSTSITLKQGEGKSVTLPRDQIDELRSDGVSFMPDGLEKNIPPQEMADLISFIKNWRYLSEAPAGGQ